MSMINPSFGDVVYIGQNGVIILLLTQLQVVYGKPLPSIPEYCIGSSHIEVVDAELSTREAILSKLHAKLFKAQQAMKHYANAKRLYAPF
ncbi:hypothetical protein CR513_53874, partial [Mucuna pruriens]